jgi:hypothetical protein
MRLITVVVLAVMWLERAKADALNPKIVFTVQNIPFCTGDALSGCGTLDRFGTEFTTVSVTGVGTPLNAGITVSGAGAGFSWIVPLAGSDPKDWDFGAADIIIEAQFEFSGNPHGPEPGDIGLFDYAFTGATSPFAISKDGSPLSFMAPVSLGIDPRLAAFYGLAPPCLVSPSPPVQAGSCSNPDPLPVETFTGTGMPTGTAGLYTFTGQLTATFNSSAPEPSSFVLLVPAAAIMIRVAWVRRKC